MVGPSESKTKAATSTPDSKSSRVVVTKASSSGKPSNRVVIGSLPEAITPNRLKELLQGIGPIQVMLMVTGLPRSGKSQGKKKNKNFSRSGKSQGILQKVRENLSSCQSQ